MGFENLRNNGGLIRDLEVDVGDSTSLKPVDYEGVDNRQYDSSDNRKVPSLGSPSSGAYGNARTPNAAVLMDHNQESGLQMNLDASEG